MPVRTKNLLRAPKPTPSRQSRDHVRNWTTPLAIIAVALATTLAYANGLKAELLFDSEVIVGGDWRLKDFSWDNIHAIATQDYWAGAKLESGLFRPVTTLSYWFQKSLLGHGANASWYVGANIALHFANSLLLFGLTRSLFQRTLPAFAAALLFSLHPLTTEAVTNVVGRADLLAAMSVAGVLWLHREANLRTGPRQIWMRVGEVALLAFGMLAKENAVVAVALVVLHDAAFLPTSTEANGFNALVFRGVQTLKTSLNLLGGFVGVFAAIWAWRICIVGTSDVPPVAAIDNPIAWLPWLEAQFTSIKTILFSLRLGLWPDKLSAEYGFDAVSTIHWPPITAQDWAVIGGALLLTVWMIAAVRQLHRGSVAAFLSLAWFVAVAPISNFFVRIGTIFGERLHYLPLMFLVALVGHAGGVWWGRWSQTLNRATIRTLRAAAFLLTGSVLVALGVRTHHRNSDWRSAVALYSSAAQVEPDACRAHLNLANALFKQAKETGLTHAKLKQVFAHGERSLAIARRLPEATRPFPMNLALAEYLQARADLAQADSTTRAADLARAYELLIEALAIERAGRAGFGKPLDDSLWGSSDLRQALGRCLVQMRRPAEAIPFLEAAAARAPTDVTVFAALSRAHLDCGEGEAAARVALQGVATNAHDAEVFAHAQEAFVLLGAPDVFGGAPGEPMIAGGAPLMRRLLDDACVRLYHLYLPHDADGKFADAFRKRAISEFGCSPTLFEAVGR